MATATLGAAYTSQLNEVSGISLDVQGRIPAWLQGSLYRNGPALFEIGDETFRHWFDGQSMLHHFQLHNGTVSYTNRMLDTANLRAHRAANGIAVEELQTAPESRGFLDRLRTIWTPPVYENANVSVKLLSGKLVAMTEVPIGIEFLPSLDTVGPVKFKDGLSGVLSTAHPHLLKDGRHLNYLTRFGMTAEYVLYTTPAADESGTGVAVERTVVKRIPADHGSASYMHSFGLSESWYVLVEFPYKFSLKKLLLDRAWYVLSNKFTGPFPDAFTWQPELGTTFSLVHRESKKLVRIRIPEAVFAYHHVNSFELDDGKLCVDLMCYDGPGYQQLTIENLRIADILDQQAFQDGAKLLRFVLDPIRGTAERIVLHSGPCELPTIDYTRFNTKAYGTVYGVEGPSTLVKVRLDGGEAQRWYGEGCSVGEPIFVSDPSQEQDDAGAVLSVVFEAATRTSFLLVLDAGTFLELARARLPQHIPPMLHGLFVPSRL